MTDFIVGVALVLVIEGTLYAAAPKGMKGMMRQMQHMPDTLLRRAGLIALAIGVAIVWMVRG